MRSAIAILVVFVLPATCAIASPPVGLVGDPLDRAARQAEPAVYEIEAIYRPKSERPVAGLAFSVSPSGYLLTANHVVRNDERIPVRIVVRQSGTDAPRAWEGRVVKNDPDNDVALVRIGARGAPALVLGNRGGGSVAAFVHENEGLVVRKGPVGSTGPVGPPVNGILTRIGVEIQGGESGGPVIGGDGRVQGMVVAYGSSSGRGLMKTTPALESLLRRSGVKNTEGAPATSFRRGMAALGRLDAPDAERQFTAARDAYPDHPTVQTALDETRRLAGADFRLGGAERNRDLLVASSVISAAAALGFGWALAVRRPRRTTLESTTEEVAHEDRDTS
jgi:Trypsin-like peptidase domain